MSAEKEKQKKPLERAEVIDTLYWKTGYTQNIGSRKEQQDNLCVVRGTLCNKPALLAVVADGMGGMEDGAAFSRIVVDYHRQHFQEVLNSEAAPADLLLALAIGANRAANQIYDDEKPGGTTLISALFTGNYFYTLSVGDSRLYLFRRKASLNRYVPLQLNREHVLGTALDERAWFGKISFEDAKNNRFRDSLTAGLGPPRMRKVDQMVNPTRFQGGDKLALMSDGIYRSLTDAELAADMEGSPDEASERIVKHILDKRIPRQDNMTILIIERV